MLAIGSSFEPQRALFLGLMLAPASIGISAQTLMELKVLRSKVGTTLMGAAAIDDILGVLGISVYIALILEGATNGLTTVLGTMLKMTVYLIVASAFGYWVLPKLAKSVEKLPISQGLTAFIFATVLFYAWSAEAIGNMAAIIGAFLAGLFLARSSLKDVIERRFSPIAYGVFVPIFFINVGLAADVRQISSGGLWLFLYSTIQKGKMIFVIAGKTRVCEASQY